MKLAIVEAMFPELRGGNIYMTARGRGGNKRVAIARAFSSLLAQASGKRVSIIKATITLSDVPEEVPSSARDEARRGKPFNATAAQVAEREAERNG